MSIHTQGRHGAFIGVGIWHGIFNGVEFGACIIILEPAALHRAGRGIACIYLGGEYE
jgi:hypothetical protein